MQVLKILKERRGVLRNAYKHSGEASHFYRLQELEYLLKRIEHDQDRGTCASGLGEDGHVTADRGSDTSLAVNG